MTYAPAKFEAALSKGLGGNAFTRNILFNLDPMARSHEALPSILCDVCTCKDWSCCGQWLRRCITKKIHYLTLTQWSRGPRSHKMLPSTLDFMWPMHQQRLMLLHPMIKETMHLQENTLFDLQGHSKCCPVPSTSCDLCTSKVWYGYIPWLRRRCIYKQIHYLTLTFGSRSHEMLPSALYIMWPMHIQSLEFLRQKV